MACTEAPAHPDLGCSWLPRKTEEHKQLQQLQQLQLKVLLQKSPKESPRAPKNTPNYSFKKAKNNTPDKRLAVEKTTAKAATQLNNLSHQCAPSQVHTSFDHKTMHHVTSRYLATYLATYLAAYLANIAATGSLCRHLYLIKLQCVSV